MTRPGLPRWLAVPAALALALLGVPLLGLLVRLPWSALPQLINSEPARVALSLSLRTCAISMGLSVALGLPLALFLARLRGRAAVWVRTLALMPMVLPPVVAGLVLLVTLGRRGVLGQWLAQAGIEIGFTTTAVVIAQTFVSMPFFVVAVEGALRTLDPGHEVVAATLGASPSVVLWRVTMPMLAPAIVNGAAMAFARSLGEFGATLTFAGSLQGTTRTMPLEIYLQRETDPDQALALSLVLILVAMVLLLASAFVQRRWGHRA
ncbi:ABC transporter permease [Propionibacteriaceae bacterium G1746]|uniref:ABC transporter permease n=1 Tax=Aestuariimicrobium sp. G57 TaxID=3418485 RepID=UPI003C1382F0